VNNSAPDVLLERFATRPDLRPPYDYEMQQIPDTDSTDFADLMDFIATSGRTRNGTFVNENAEQLVTSMWADRAQAMTQSLVAVAKASSLFGKR